MALLPWNKIETVLLDMDGTLLDLHFDNQFWLHYLPQKYSEKTGKPLTVCHEELKETFAKLQGKLEWYCLDYWGEHLGLDILQAKNEIAHLIRVRQDSIIFLQALRQSKRKVVLVTNAHPDSLALKVEKTRLNEHVDTLISTHQFGAPKEFQSLWQQLQKHLGFDPQSTLFVDDGERILDAAKKFGIAYTLGISNPDSQLPENTFSNHPHINDYRDLVDIIIDKPFAPQL